MALCHIRRICIFFYSRKNIIIVSLYIHIPFCIKRCTYCDFITHTDNSNELIEKYVENLCNEIKSYKSHNLTLGTVFFGGGTPSVLRIDLLAKIFDAINFTFTVPQNIEITIEINPINLNRGNLKKYLSLGINRLSMGVQTFNDTLLKEINRNHSVEDIYKTYNSARDAGFKNFSLDLIFGLPNQKTDVWIDTLHKTVALNSEHISLYCLDLHDNTPLYDLVGTGVYSLPEESEILKMFEYAQKYLKQNQFEHYEISNWAKAGYQAKHNIVYWKNFDYIGVGVSAASYYLNKRYVNTKDLKEYLKIENFDLFINTKKQDLKEELEETIFMNLRLIKDGLNIIDLNKRFGIDFCNYYKEELNELSIKKLITIDNNIIRLAEKSIFVSNEVFEKFIK